MCSGRPFGFANGKRRFYKQHETALIMKVVYEEIVRRFPEIRDQLHDNADLPYVQMNGIVEWLQSLPAGAIDAAMIGRVKSFYDWCAAQPRGKTADDDIYTMFIVGFYEKLFRYESTHSLITHLASKDDLVRNAQYLKSWVGEENYGMVLRLFP